jgi:HSP20 family protein
MTTTSRQPRWGNFGKQFNEVEQLFDHFFGPQGAAATAAWRAPLSLWEDETHFHVEMEAPGVKKEDFELTVEKNVLHLIAERRKPAEGRNYWHDERRYGRIERKVTLPDTVDSDAVQAHFAEGVLHVTLGKKPEAQPKRIVVSAAE